MDDTDLQGRCQRLEAENKRLWSANDEVMRDQVESDKRIDKLEKRLEKLEKGLKPPAKGSVE